MKDEEIDNLLKELDKYGLIEFVKSSRIAIIKSSEGVHKRVLDMELNDPTKKPINNEFLNHKSMIFEMQLQKIIEYRQQNNKYLKLKTIKNGKLFQFASTPPESSGIRKM